jgi:hypothetical protein
MKKSFSLAFVFASIIFFTSKAQVVLNADGPGNTYELVNSVLAPGYDAVEAPDLIHGVFGRHITEVFDAGLNKNVFEFVSHVTPDNDPNNPATTDRQRVEIKTYEQSPANLIGTVGETVTYKWRFKIPVGFQPSSNFTHFHQIKAVGGDDGDPLFTLTARAGTPNKLELIYVPDMNTSQDKKQTVNLSAFEGVWVEVTEKILVNATGSYSIQIKRVTDNAVLMAYTNTNIATIRPDNTFIRPKWGIYRSLLSPGDLRDEAVRFSDFSITEGFTPFGPQTYFWTGNVGPVLFFNTANWNTALDGSGTSRNPLTDDILVMDGSNVAGNIFPVVTGPVTAQMQSNTIGQLKLQNNMQLILQRTGGTSGNLTIAGDGTLDPDFTIPAGSSVTINSPSGTGAGQGSVTINLANPAAGLVEGTFTITNTGSHRITSQTASGLVFTAGSTFNADGTPTATNYPFGGNAQAVQNGVVFQPGSNLVVTGNRSPMGNISSFQACLMMTGSNTYFRSTNPIASFGSWSNNKTFGNVFIQNNATFSSDGAFYKIDTLTIDNGSTFITHSSGSTPVLGNIVANGNLSPSSAIPSTNTLILGGSVPQTISGTGSIKVSNLAVANGSSVTFNKSITIDSSANIFGKINLGATSQITGGGSFSTKTQSNPINPAPTSVTGNLVLDSFAIRGVVAATNALGGINGLRVTGTGIAPNTNVVGFSASAGVINLSKPATLTGSTTLTFSSDSATIETSNANGIDSLTGGVVVIGDKSFASGTNYIVNAATNKPIGISSGNTTNMQVGNITFNAASTTNYNTRLRGTLTLNTGKLTVRATDTLRVTNGNDIAGAPFSTSKYIVLERSGSNLGVLRMDNFSTAKTFPIGTATNYLPVTLTPTSAMSYAVTAFDGATVDGTPSGALVSAATKDESVDAQWILDRKLGSGNCTVDLAWPASIEGSNFSSLTSTGIGISRYNGTEYEIPAGMGDNVANTASSTFEFFSPFFVTKKAGVVPVNFKNITATLKQKSTEVNWEVGNEVNIVRYIVEKSTNGRTFTSIGSVVAYNSSTYTFDDASVSESEVYFYRVKSEELTGEIKYSNIVFVKIGNSKDVTVYPNPVGETLSIAGLKGNTVIKLINSTGQVLIQQSTSVSSLSIDATGLKTGIYLLQVFSNGKIQDTKTIIKQ